MQFRRPEVERLLTEQYERIEDLFQQSPYDEVRAYAVTIKEFMADHGVADVVEGIERFVAFKQDQTLRLAELGLGRSEFSLPPPRLVHQAA